MALENREIFGAHGQAEDGFEHNQPCCPGVERFEPRQATEEPRASYRIDYVVLKTVDLAMISLCLWLDEPLNLIGTEAKAFP